jgi:5-formyltetrahydrofolate cyclo-ligase
VSEDPSHRLKARKRALRRAAIERRDLLSASERSAKSEEIVERVLALPEVGAARTVMAFWSFGSEVQTAALIERLREAGKRVVLPRVQEEEIAAVAYEPGDPVAATSFGAMEPAEGDLVPAEDVDVVIVPGVAFDRRGGRVGYGGGFYDRFFSRAQAAPAVAVAFAVQLVDAVPQGRSDARVDAIVTEDEVIRPRHDASA